MKTVKAYIYSRVSSLQQVDLFGIDRQINTVMDFLESAKLPDELGYQLDPNNYEVLESDKGLSGYKGVNWTKGSLGKFKERVASGEITEGCLLIESVDRFGRLEGYDAVGNFMFLITRNIDIIEVETGQIYSYKLEHKLSMLSTSIERAYQESKRKSRISKKSWQNRKSVAVEKRSALNNNTPDWLTLSDDKYSYNIDHEQVTLITRMFNLYASGVGVTDIVKTLNSEGYKNNGRNWNTVTLYNKLRDRRLNGYLVGKYKTISKKDSESTSETEYRVLSNKKAKEEANINAIRIYPIVIEDELFSKVQILMDKNVQGRKPKSTTSKQRNLFNGISKCMYCGSPMIVQAMSKGGQYLRCYRERSKNGVCESKLIRYVETERFLLNHIQGLNLDLIYELDNAEGNNTDLLRNQLVAVNAKIDELNSNMKNAVDEDDLILLLNFKRKRMVERDELITRINQLETESSMLTLDYNYDIEEICNHDNSTLRRKTNIHIGKVIRSIKCGRYDYGESVRYIFDIAYHKDFLKHVLITDNRCNLITNISIWKREEVTTYQTPTFALEVTDEELRLTVKERLSVTDYFLLLNYVDAIDTSKPVAVWLRENANNVLLELA